MFTLCPDPYVRRLLGARVRALRLQRGLTQAQVAEQLGLQQAWMAKVEAGRSDPSIGRLRALCQVLNCDPALLLSL